MEERHSSWKMLCALSALTLFAFLSRLWGLGQWAVQGDETTTILNAAERARHIVNPAYYNLVLLTRRLLGEGALSARLPAFLLGTASIPLLYVMGRRILDRRSALLAVLLAALSSWHLWYCQFARFYSGVFLFGSLAYALFYVALRRNSLPVLFASLLTAAAAALFHLTSVMIVASCGLFSVLVVARGNTAPYSKRIAVWYLVLCAGGFLAGLPFFLKVALARRTAAGGVSWGHLPPFMVLEVVRKVQLPIAVSAFFGFLCLWRTDREKAIFFLTTCSVPLAALVLGSAFVDCHAAYAFYVLPLLLLLAAFFWESLRRSLSGFPQAAWGSVALIVLLLLPEWISHYTGKTSCDVRKAVAFVRERFKPNDVILSFVGEFNFYARGELPEPYRSGHHRYPDPSWEALVRKSREQGKRLWVVLPIWRRPHAAELEQFLLSEGRLRWRRTERRLDYLVHGYEIFTVNG